MFAFRRQQVEAVLGYYAEFTAEIDPEIEGNAAAADEAERLWQRGRDLLTS